MPLSVAERLERAEDASIDIGDAVWDVVTRCKTISARARAVLLQFRKKLVALEVGAIEKLDGWGKPFSGCAAPLPVVTRDAIAALIAELRASHAAGEPCPAVSSGLFLSMGARPVTTLQDAAFGLRALAAVAAGKHRPSTGLERLLAAESLEAIIAGLWLDDGCMVAAGPGADLFRAVAERAGFDAVFCMIEAPSKTVIWLTRAAGFFDSWRPPRGGVVVVPPGAAPSLRVATESVRVLAGNPPARRTATARHGLNPTAQICRLFGAGVLEYVVATPGGTTTLCFAEGAEPGLASTIDSVFATMNTDVGAGVCTVAQAEATFAKVIAAAATEAAAKLVV